MYYLNKLRRIISKSVRFKTFFFYIKDEACEREQKGKFFTLSRAHRSSAAPRRHRWFFPAAIKRLEFLIFMLIVISVCPFDEKFLFILRFQIKIMRLSTYNIK